jgi:hypothetical protein
MTVQEKEGMLSGRGTSRQATTNRMWSKQRSNPGQEWWRWVVGVLLISAGAAISTAGGSWILGTVVMAIGACIMPVF